MRRPWRHDEAGSAGPVTLLGTAVAMTLAVALLVVVTDLCLAAARARAAADAAALAGAATSPLVSAGGRESAQAAARRTATANGAEWITGDTRGWPLRYGVTVEARPRTRWVHRIAGPVRARAFGGVRPSRPETGR